MSNCVGFFGGIFLLRWKEPRQLVFAFPGLFPVCRVGLGGGISAPLSVADGLGGSAPGGSGRKWGCSGGVPTPDPAGGVGGSQVPQALEAATAPCVALAGFLLFCGITLLSPAQMGREAERG